jgi:hypothetical protein
MEIDKDTKDILSLLAILLLGLIAIYWGYFSKHRANGKVDFAITKMKILGPFAILLFVIGLIRKLLEMTSGH